LSYNVPMMITLSAVRRAHGLLDYTKEGPGTFKMRNVMPPVFEKLEGQMEANCASHDEIKTFIEELHLRGVASVSFPVRRCNFFAL
jgi:hypothetical protein